jgi:hypothetical protein
MGKAMMQRCLSGRFAVWFVWGCDATTRPPNRCGNNLILSTLQWTELDLVIKSDCNCVGSDQFVIMQSC